MKSDAHLAPYPASLGGIYFLFNLLSRFNRVDETSF